MFEKISKRKLKGLMLWKYLFQLLLTPIILSILMNLLFFIDFIDGNRLITSYKPL